MVSISSENDDNPHAIYPTMFPSQGPSGMPQPDGTYTSGNGLQMYSGGYLPNYNLFATHQQTPSVPMPQMPPMSQMFTGANLAMNTGFTLGENYGDDYSPDMSAAPNYEYAPLIKDKKERNSKLDEVSGRLGLLSHTKKHLVTIGEICRRMSAPETLHTSLLNSILRNAKAKDNGSKLRSNLRNFNIDLPQGRRKTCRMTGFTAFCEGEAHLLAQDFNELMKDKGGADVIGKDYATELMNDTSTEEILKQAEFIERFLNYIISKHHADQMPDDLQCETPVDKAIMTLSLFTHGFSHVVLAGVALYFKNIIAEVKSQVHKHQASDITSPISSLSRMPAMLPNNYYGHPPATNDQ